VCVRPVVTDKQSEIARAILGPERLAAIGELVEERADPSREPIPVHDALVGLELQTGWITAVFDRLFSATEALAAIDFNDGKRLGATLPGVWDELIVAATEADDLERFLERFALGTGESWVDVASCALSAAQGWALMVIIAVHGDDETEEDGDEETVGIADADGDADREERAEAEAEVREWAGSLANLPSRHLEAPGFNEAVSFAMGFDVAGSSALSTPGQLLSVGARQLGLILPPDRVMAGYERDYYNQSLYLSSHANPLLIRRSAMLTRRLIDGALERDRALTERELGQFFATQAARIQSSGLRIEADVGSFYRDNDPLAMLSAYRGLAEGVLRRFAQLILRLEAIAAGEELGEKNRPPLLNALDEALKVSGSQLASCLRLGIEPALRNAEAHEEVVVNAAGELVVGTDIGDVIVAPGDIEQRFLLLRAALAGVDLGTNSVFYSHEIAIEDEINHTDASLMYLAQRIAADHTDGQVTKLTIAPGEVTVTVVECADKWQLYRLVRTIASALATSVTRARIIDESGEPLAVFDQFRRDPERNDRCPCGSGVKFKRCHGR
jgi:SEC-C motif